MVTKYDISKLATANMLEQGEQSINGWIFLERLKNNSKIIPLPESISFLDDNSLANYLIENQKQSEVREFLEKQDKESVLLDFKNIHKHPTLGVRFITGIYFRKQDNKWDRYGLQMFGEFDKNTLALVN